MHQLLKQGLRALCKTPFVTLIAVFSLALGIGANSAIFSLFDQMLLRDLPVPAPERLVNLVAPGPKVGSQSCGAAGDCDHIFSYPMFRDLEQGQQVLGSLGAHVDFVANLAFEGSTSSTEGQLVSGGFFPTLGLAPALGRLIAPGDDRAIGESPVVVVSHDYWQERFSGRRDIVDQTLIVNGQPMTMIGVAPASFQSNVLGSRPDVYVPITMHAEMKPGWGGFESRRNYWVYVFGRLAPGISLDQAQATLSSRYSTILREVEAPLQEGMSAATMEQFLAKPLVMVPGSRGQSTMHGQVRTPLLLLFAVAGVVLLIACANIANLLLARSASRTGEIAVRLSIGATRPKLISQLLTESCLLAALGGVAGLFIARWTLALIGQLLPASSIRGLHLGLEMPAVLFAMVLALGTGILFGLFPALHSTRPNLATTLKGRSGQQAGARSAARFRMLLVTAQIALSTTLLVAAGLFLRSLVNISRVELGIAVDNLATFRVSPALNGYTPDRARTLFERTEEALDAIPGVAGVTASMVPVLTGSNWGDLVLVEGFDAGPEDSDRRASFNVIGSGYFQTMGIGLLAGREFTTADAGDAVTVAIVNQAFADRFGLGNEAVGKRMAIGGAIELDVEIVGLVPNVKHSDVKGAAPPLFFTPYRQSNWLRSISFYVRTAGPPANTFSAIAAAVHELDPNLPVDRLKTMPQQVKESVFIDRMLTTLSAAFAVLATLLAAVGLYGVLTFTVSQRTREFGLRMVLGASSGSLLRLVLGQVGKMVLAGTLIGLVAAVALGTVARRLLFELQGHDPIVLIGSTFLLALVALAAGLLPARKAASIEPMRALHYE